MNAEKQIHKEKEIGEEVFFCSRVSGKDKKEILVAKARVECVLYEKSENSGFIVNAYILNAPNKDLIRKDKEVFGTPESAYEYGKNNESPQECKDGIPLENLDKLIEEMSPELKSLLIMAILGEGKLGTAIVKVSEAYQKTLRNMLTCAANELSYKTERENIIRLKIDAIKS